MAVNIYNPEAILKYLGRGVLGVDITPLLAATLYKPLLKREESAVLLTELPDDAPEWLQNKWDICGPFHKFEPDRDLTNQVSHIKDWLLSTLGNGDTPSIEQLKNLGSLEAATAAADKYFEELNKKQPKIIEDDNDTKTVMSFDDGSRIVQLLTPNTLKYEGSAMGHCIGGGSYDQDLLNGSCVFYSLRDKDNNPHATFHVEVEGNILHQCKGKQNEPPVQKYMPFVQQFVTENKFQLKEGPRHTGLIQDDKGLYHSIFNLPENLSVGDDLDLNHCIGLTHLPENLSVGGPLFLRGCTGLTELPKKLSVGSGLDLTGCTGLTKLPENLSVRGSLILTNCTGLTEIGNHISVGVSLHLTGCEKLRVLRDNLSVKHHIFLEGCTNLTKIGDNLSVGGDLMLGECRGLTELPANLNVGGYLSLRDCTGLTKLPEDLTAKDWLYLGGCAGLKSIPRTIIKGNGLVYTDLGNFDTIAEAADAFDKKYGRAVKAIKVPSQLKTRVA